MAHHVKTKIGGPSRQFCSKANANFQLGESIPDTHFLLHFRTSKRFHYVDSARLALNQYVGARIMNVQPNNRYISPGEPTFANANDRMRPERRSIVFIAATTAPRQVGVWAAVANLRPFDCPLGSDTASDSTDAPCL